MSAQPSTSRRRLPRAEREREILEVATRVFSQRGYHATSMDEVAELSGVSKPMVYAYIGSKEELYLACIRRAGEALMRSIAEAADDSLPADQQLWRGILAFFEFVNGERDGWAVLYREASVEGGPSAETVARMRKGVVRVVAQLLAETAADAGLDAALVPEAEPLAHAVVGAGESLANWWAEHPDDDPARLAVRLMNFVWTGLGRLLEGELWLPPEGAPGA